MLEHLEWRAQWEEMPVLGVVGGFSMSAVSCAVSAQVPRVLALLVEVVVGPLQLVNLARERLLANSMG